MSDLFISDLHLGPDRPDLFKAFCTFISKLDSDVEQLYILGDLFDVWVGDDDANHFQNEVIARLKMLEKRHIRLFVMRGNRDFLYGKRFEREAGATLLPDHYLYQCGPHRALLMHGDLLCSDDRDYLRYRSIVRNPLIFNLLRCLPMPLKRQIGKKLRAKSSQENQQKSMTIMDITETALLQTVRRYSVGRIIHGHTHRPGTSRHQLGGHQLERMVLGDWGDKVWWIVRDSRGFSLQSRPTKELISG